MKTLPTILTVIATLGLLSSACLTPGFAQENKTDSFKYYKGNTHTHSLWSDGNDFPEMIVDWYAKHEYHFMALSDHNVLSRGERWMNNRAIERRKKTIGHSPLKKYKARFGEKWVETRGEGDQLEVRLRRLDEYRGQFEKAEKFLLLEGEEITDGFENRPVHINAINLSNLIPPRHGKSVREVMRNNLKAVREEEERSGKPILAHIDHPNFGWALTPQDLAHVTEARYVEVYNGHPGINHLGKEGVPGDEVSWDIANTIRLVELNAAPLYGVATDDSHTYHGGKVSPGRGWVMVRSDKLEADALIRAMKAGDFYASSGVSLKSITWGKNEAGKKQLTIEVLPAEASGPEKDQGQKEKEKEEETFVIEFIGTRKSADGKQPPAESIGAVLKSVTGTKASYTLQGDELYVRATVTSSRFHSNPSFKDQKVQAWTQPVGWVLAAQPEEKRKAAPAHGR